MRANAKVCQIGEVQYVSVRGNDESVMRRERTSTTFSRPRKAAAIGLVRKNLDARDCGDER